jgi:hypothetical protein
MFIVISGMSTFLGWGFITKVQPYEGRGHLLGPAAFTTA